MARLSRGDEMPYDSGGSTEASASILFTKEDDISDTVVPRLLVAGADMGRISTYKLAGSEDIEGGVPFTIPEDLDRLEQAMRETGARLVVIDPFASYLSQKWTQTVNDKARSAMTPLAALARRTNVAIVLIRHFRKAEAGKAIYKGGGAIDYAAAARSVLAVVEAPDDPTHERLLVSVKVNNAATPPSLRFGMTEPDDFGAASIEWLGEDDSTAADVMTGDVQPGQGREPTKAEAASPLVRGWLKDSPLPPKEIVSRLAGQGITIRESGGDMARLKKACGATSFRVGNGSGSYFLWEIPEFRENYSEKVPEVSTGN